QFLAHAGIALATAIAAWLNAIALGIALVRRGHLVLDARLRRRVLGVAVSAVLMGAVVYGCAVALAEPLAGSELRRIPALMGIVFSGLGSFAIFAHLFGAFRLADLKAAFRRRGAR
ncbi:MAG: murein biosynthesis integral membrane protein MurJ, partial [Alphaproteobacteria bacterium]